MENMDLWCSICSKPVIGNLKFFCGHFRRYHSLVQGAGTGFRGYICGQEGCARKFTYISTMTRHIQKMHLGSTNNAGGQASNRGEEEDDRGQIQNLDGPSRDFHGQVGVDPPEDDSLGDEFEEMEEEEEFNLDDAVLRMICNLRCNTSVTGTLITSVMEECAGLYEEIVTALKKKVVKFCHSKNIQGDPDAEELLREFELKDCFQSLNTLPKQLKALEKKKTFVAPEEVFLGSRVDYVLSPTLNTYVPKLITETYHYVSIIETLRVVLSNKAAREEILLSSYVRDEEILASFEDGKVYSTSDFFQKYPNAIRLLIYYDEVEVVNPLGSKVQVHKIGAFYVTIMNFKRNSKLSSIHNLMLCCDDDIRKYGFRVVLNRFLQDLNVLEKGIEMVFNGVAYNVFATVAAFSGDTLAAHEIFGLLGPSAKKFCRLCDISRNDLLAGKAQPGTIRTKDLYEEQLAYVNENPADATRPTETGIATDCALHSSCNFRLYNNWSFDILHDLFEGVVQYALKLVIHKYVIVQRLCTVEDLNRNIHSFNYGSTDVKNKPSSNFSANSLRNLSDNTLKQKGAQVWCLLRIFPFLFNHLVERGDDHMELILQLIRIVEIVVAPTIATGLLPYLTELIGDHLALFRELFPEMPLINKHHHLTHYPECIRQIGPLVYVWCMRFKGANAILNRHGKVMCNFRNVAKTLIRVGQFQQFQTWGHGTYESNGVSSSKGTCVEVGSLLSAEQFRARGFKDSDKIYTTQAVSVGGTMYRVSMFMCTAAARIRSKNLPLFGKIEEILVVQQKPVMFLLSLVEPTCYDPDFHAYPVLLSSPNHNLILLNVDDLADYRPLSAWKSPPKPDQIFLSFHDFVL